MVSAEPLEVYGVVLVEGPGRSYRLSRLVLRIGAVGLGT